MNGEDLAARASVLDRHVEGLFSRERWLRARSDAGFEPRVVPFNHSELEPGRSGVFVASVRRNAPDQLAACTFGRPPAT